MHRGGHTSKSKTWLGGLAVLLALGWLGAPPAVLGQAAPPASATPTLRPAAATAAPQATAPERSTPTPPVAGTATEVEAATPTPTSLALTAAATATAERLPLPLLTTPTPTAQPAEPTTATVLPPSPTATATRGASASPTVTATVVTTTTPTVTAFGVQPLITCQVTDNSDSSTDTGSIRYLVTELDEGDCASNTITFASTLSGETITLSNGVLLINGGSSGSPDTIDASSLSSGVTISGNNASGVFSISLAGC